MKRLFTLITAVFFLALVPGAILMAQEKPARAAKAQGKKDAGVTQKTSATDSAVASADKSTTSKDPLENMRFRNLGPAVGGGRVTAVVGVPGKPNIYYVGSGGGGIFLTQDGGLSWKAIFEKES